MTEARMQYLALFLLRLVARNLPQVVMTILDGNDALTILGEKTRGTGVSPVELRELVERLKQEALEAR